MLKFQIIVNGAGSSIENDFFNFVEDNELCTVEHSCQIDDTKWILEMIPYMDEYNKSDFLQLCNELVNFLEEMGYEF